MEKFRILRGRVKRYKDGYIMETLWKLPMTEDKPHPDS